MTAPVPPPPEMTSDERSSSVTSNRGLLTTIAVLVVLLLGAIAAWFAQYQTTLDEANKVRQLRAERATAWAAVDESSCRTAVSTAANEPDADAADPLIHASLSTCGSADEWLDAVREFPASMGLNHRAEIGALELEIACFGWEHTPVCVDAIAKGLVEAS